MSTGNFIASFLQRKGGWVVLSSYFAKIATFLIALFIARYLEKDEYGYIVYATTIIAFLAPFKGLGIHQGFLRYASIAENQRVKKFYFLKTLKTGLLYDVILVAAVCLLSPFIASNLGESLLYIALISLQLIGLFIIDTIKIYARVVHLNKLFSKIVFYNNFVLLIAAIVLTMLLGGLGYILALIIVPMGYGVALLFKLKLINISVPEFTFNKKEFVSYGFFLSLGGVLSQLLYAVDIMLIGNIIKDSSAVAEYKVANIIPFSLLILPVAILTTDFVKISNQAEQDKYSVLKYFISYLKIMMPIAIIIVVSFYFLSDYLILLFGDQYSNDNNLMFIFSIGVAGALMLRIPLGNILSAVGWPKINALFSFIILLINLAAGYYYVNLYGILGAAYTTVALMWGSGILSLFALIYFLKNR